MSKTAMELHHVEGWHRHGIHCMILQPIVVPDFQVVQPIIAFTGKPFVYNSWDDLVRGIRNKQTPFSGIIKNLRVMHAITSSFLLLSNASSTTNKRKNSLK